MTRISLRCRHTREEGGWRRAVLHVLSLAILMHMAHLPPRAQWESSLRAWSACVVHHPQMYSVASTTLGCEAQHITRRHKQLPFAQFTTMRNGWVESSGEWRVTSLHQYYIPECQTACRFRASQSLILYHVSTVLYRGAPTSLQNEPSPQPPSATCAPK